MNRSTPGLPVHHQLPEFTQTHVHRVRDAIQPLMPSSHLILCRPLLLLPPIPPSIRVFSNESTLPMRWPKYWSFSFRIIPSKEIPGLISFRMDWLDLLAVQGTQSLVKKKKKKDFNQMLLNIYMSVIYYMPSTPLRNLQSLFYLILLTNPYKKFTITPIFSYIIQLRHRS